MKRTEMPENLKRRYREFQRRTIELAKDSTNVALVAGIVAGAVASSYYGDWKDSPQPIELPAGFLGTATDVASGPNAGIQFHFVPGRDDANWPYEAARHAEHDYADRVFREVTKT